MNQYTTCMSTIVVYKRLAKISLCHFMYMQQDIFVIDISNSKSLVSEFLSPYVLLVLIVGISQQLSPLTLRAEFTQQWNELAVYTCANLAKTSLLHSLLYKNVCVWMKLLSDSITCVCTTFFLSRYRPHHCTRIRQLIE